MVPNIARRLIKSLFHAVGADIVRFENSPRETLLGLRQVSFRSVIDCGANEGQFARWISGFFPEAKLYCFEPLQGPYEKLEKWAVTQAGRVHCFRVALGNEPGEAVMHEHTKHSPSSSLLATTQVCHDVYPQTRSQHQTRVKITTLDKALSSHIGQMPREILLKLDVQGFEDRVLRGGVGLLSQCRAVILEVCIDPLYEGQADFLGLAQLLHSAGLHYVGNLEQSYGEDGRVVFLDAVFVK